MRQRLRNPHTTQLPRFSRHLPLAMAFEAAWDEIESNSCHLISCRAAKEQVACRWVNGDDPSERPRKKRIRACVLPELVPGKAPYPKACLSTC